MLDLRSIGVFVERFSKDVRLIIPINEKKQSDFKNEENKVRYVINEAFCPNGCNIIDPERKINGSPGLRIRFSRQGAEGEFVISAIEGDFDKIILKGELENGLPDELFVRIAVLCLKSWSIVIVNQMRIWL